jgi:hypothetical protein
MPGNLTFTCISTPLRKKIVRLEVKVATKMRLRQIAQYISIGKIHILSLL